MSREEFLELMDEDIAHHESAVDCYEEGCEGWNFHLGCLETLVKYRHKIVLLEEVK